MNKHLRELLKAIIAEGAVVLEQSQTGRGGHHAFTLKLPNGKVRKITASNTPVVAEHAIKNVVKDIRKLCEQ